MYPIEARVDHHRVPPDTTGSSPIHKVIILTAMQESSCQNGAVAEGCHTLEMTCVYQAVFVSICKCAPSRVDAVGGIYHTAGGT